MRSGFLVGRQILSGVKQGFLLRDLRDLRVSNLLPR